MITDNIVIEQADLELAKEICGSINDIEIRNSSVANVLAAKLASKMFTESVYNFDNESGIHNIAEVLNDIDIADVYINENYVDVRLSIDEGIPCIPLQNIRHGIIPCAYMFLKATSDLNKVELLGFIEGEFAKNIISSDEYYLVNQNELKSFEEIESLIKSAQITDININDSDIYNFIEKIDLLDKYEFYKQLTQSRSGRIKFKKILDAQTILNLISYANSTNESVNSDNSEELILSDLLNEDDFEPEENIIDTTLSLLEEPINNNSASEYSTVVEANIYDENNTTEEPNIDLVNNINFNNIDDNTNDNENNNIEYSQDASIQDNSIDELFNEGHFENDTKNSQGINNNLPKIILAGLLAVLVAIGSYFGFTKLTQNQNGDKVTSKSLETNDRVQNDKRQQANDSLPMPMETIEKDSTQNVSKETGNSVAIPSIEKNLDSSVLVSNLKVDWEVPAGYASNTSAKRYMIKLGKVIQLNLKSELLLLSKLPITNTITVELKFNNSAGQFETVGIISSSGESSIDKIIIDTINKALKMKLSTHPSVFNKLKGNPILIIHF